MDGIQLALPRPGPAVKALLIALGVIALGEGILVNWTKAGAAVLDWVVLSPKEVLHEPWTLLTTAFFTDPTSYSHVLFSLLGLYFLGTAMESHWGTARFLRFVGLTAVLSYAVSSAIAVFAPEGLAILHPKWMIGPDGVLTALAIAFGREFPTRVIRLFFFLPVSGRVIVWITIGFAFLGLVFPSATYEGTATRIAAVGFGLLLAGTPSPLRALYLRAKLAFLRRGSGGARVDLSDRPAPKRRGGPPLRVVRGGLDDDERPPKDQLN
jgi:membrane associated rhomboid family serine protease